MFFEKVFSSPFSGLNPRCRQPPRQGVLSPLHTLDLTPGDPLSKVVPNSSSSPPGHGIFPHNYLNLNLGQYYKAAQFSALIYYINTKTSLQVDLNLLKNINNTMWSYYVSEASDTRLGSSIAFKLVLFIPGINPREGMAWKLATTLMYLTYPMKSSTEATPPLSTTLSSMYSKYTPKSHRMSSTFKPPENLRYKKSASSRVMWLEFFRFSLNRTQPLTSLTDSHSMYLWFWVSGLLSQCWYVSSLFGWIHKSLLRHGAIKLRWYGLSWWGLQTAIVAKHWNSMYQDHPTTVPGQGAAAGPWGRCCLGWRGWTTLWVDPSHTMSVTKWIKGQ